MSDDLVELKLDQALEATFPASDPIAITLSEYGPRASLKPAPNSFATVLE